MADTYKLTQFKSLQELSTFVSSAEDFQVKIGSCGGRRFSKGHFVFSLNQLVSELIHLSEKQLKETKSIKSLITNIRAMDALPSPKTSLIQRILTAIRRLFGNFFFNRKALLNELENKLPKVIEAPKNETPQSIPLPVVTPVEQPQETKPNEKSSEQPPEVLKPIEEPILKPVEHEPVKVVTIIEPPKSTKTLKPPPVTTTFARTYESKRASTSKHDPLDDWIHQPNSTRKSMSLFMGIRKTRTFPDAIPPDNESVEGVLMQASENNTIDLQEESSLMIIEGIFQHCVVTKIMSQLTAKDQEDIFGWLGKQKTLGVATIESAIKGHLAHLTINFSVLLGLVAIIKTRNLEKNPPSLGKALAKLVEMNANDNGLERLFEFFIRKKRISKDEYALILDTFNIKLADKGNLDWKILNLLKAYATEQGF